MTTSLISIVTPCFRAEKTIADTIASACRQTFPYWEMVLISDDEVDYEKLVSETLKELDLTTHKDRFKYYSTNQVATGPSVARNIGLEHSKGDYIFFLDADDKISNNFFELVLPLTRNFGVAAGGTQLFGSNIRANDQNRHFPTKLNKPLAFDVEDVSNFAFTPKVMQKRETVSNFDEKFNQGEMILNLFQAYDLAISLNEGRDIVFFAHASAMYYYNINPHSIVADAYDYSSPARSNSFEDLIKAAENGEHHFENPSVKKAYLECLRIKISLRGQHQSSGDKNDFRLWLAQSNLFSVQKYTR